MGEQVTIQRETAGNVVKTFSWSVDDRLLAVERRTSGAQDWLVSYRYDHRGERISRTGAASAGRYLVDGENPTGYTQALAEIRDDGSPRANYWYAGEFGPIAQAHDPGTPEFDVRFLLGDHLSTTRGLTDSAGSFTGYSYSPFGSLTEGDGSLTDYYFTGQWREALTGLQYHRARWLNPAASSWISVDSLFDWPENFGHYFTYAGQNPLYYSDPSGTFTLLETVVVAAIISGLVSMNIALMQPDATPEDALWAFIGGAVLGALGALFGVGLSALAARFVWAKILFYTLGALLTAFGFYEAYTAETLEERIFLGILAIVGVALGAASIARSIGAKIASRSGPTATQVARATANPPRDVPEVAPSYVQTTRWKLWSRTKDFLAPSGRHFRVYQRNDINPRLRDHHGRTNYQRMKAGLPPVDENGRPMVLHHMGQNPDGPLVEMTEEMHWQYDAILHPLKRQGFPSRIDRPEFNIDREAYWIERAAEFFTPGL